MKHYRIRFGFSRGRRGDVVELGQDTAEWLADCGLIDPEPLPDTPPGPEDTKVITPQTKEGGHVRSPTTPRRKRRPD